MNVKNNFMETSVKKNIMIVMNKVVEKMDSVINTQVVFAMKIIGEIFVKSQINTSVLIKAV